MNIHTVTVDVRGDICSGGDPFAKIMGAVAALRGDEQLLLIAPFEPVPLFQVLEKAGFQHTTQPGQDGDWRILFYRSPESAPQNRVRAAPRDSAGGGAVSAPSEIVEVDARRLEPPQPMVKILEALAVLPGGAELRARTDRRPLHLYSQLEDRGFTGESQEQNDGSFITHIRRA